MTADAAVNTTSLLSEGVLGITGNVLAAIIIICGVAVAILLFLVVGWLQRKADKTASQIDDIVMAAIGTPAVVAVLVVAFYLALQVADLPAGLEWIKESRYLDAFFVIIGAWIVSSFAYDFISVYGHRIASRTETDFDDRMIALGLVITKYVIWFAAILIILSILDIDITPLLAGAGIVTLAVALAAQDIFSNFFGGAVIAVDKPFKLHDRIKIDQYYGDIISVGPRSTRLKTLDNQIVTIPNSKLVDSFIVNYALPDTRLKVRIPIGVAYGSDVIRVKEILLEVAREMAEKYDYILTEPEPSVYFLEFGDSSLNFMLLLWTCDFSMTWDVQDVINTRIYQKFAEVGIEIPFPQMDVHLRK
jgi:MscS family membrane protein